MATITGTSGPDSLDGGDEDDTVLGLGGGDTLRGGAGGDDILRGGAGGDELIAGTGADLLIGGTGNDYLTHDETMGPVAFTARGEAGNDFFDLSELAQGSISGGGSGGYDTLRLDWADAAVTLTTAGATAGGRSLAIAGMERFEISASGFDDDITTGRIADAISAGLGNNIVHSGGGDDAVSYTARDVNMIDGGAGEHDQLETSVDPGFVLDFSVTGGTATDGLGSTLLGFEFYDLRGGAGDDRISAGSRGDLLRGGRGADTLDGNGGRDSLRGGLGDDLVRGGAGNDALSGQRGADVLDGGAGDDRLYGSRDDDTMTGGDGADRFIFQTTEIGRITITDFVTGVDALEIRTALLPFLDVTGPLDPSLLAFGAASGPQGQLVLIDRPALGLTRLVWDANGEDPSGGTSLIAEFVGTVVLAASDILVI